MRMEVILILSPFLGEFRPYIPSVRTVESGNGLSRVQSQFLEQAASNLRKSFTNNNIIERQPTCMSFLG